MRKGTDWKTAAKYVSGMLVLAMSVAAALLFPEWYCEWQDRQIMETVTLTSRENIEFLDTDSLDIAGRIQLLSQAESMSWMEHSDVLFATESEGYSFLERCRKAVQRWCDSDLLPEDCAQWVSDTSGEIVFASYIYADQSAFRVLLMRFYGPDASQLTFVIDAEMDIIYYASVVSGQVQEKIAGILGYESFTHLLESIEIGDFPHDVSEDYSGYDFASVCGAEMAVIRGEPGYPELTIELQYDNFSASAYRSIVENEAGVGIAIMYGTEQWKTILEEMMSFYGYWESPVDLREVVSYYADAGTAVSDSAIPKEEMMFVE